MRPGGQRFAKGVFCLSLLWSWQVAGGGETAAPAEIKPSDVFVRVEMMREELERVRFVMGRPKNRQPEIGVQGAAPREVYFQVITMFRKSERLCFEHTREHAVEPELPTGEITPGDVYLVVEAALERIQRLKTQLGIREVSQPAQPNPAKTPTDVFRSAVQANRQLNLLLERRIAPGDVFQQVTFGVGYASRLLEQFPDATTIPEPPAFEVGKLPGDVYRRLLGCFEQIRRIAKASGLEMLELKIDEDRISAAEPSDVYDIASLLVSELAFLHSRLAETKPPRKAYYAGRKFPSHVYQRAGILELQLGELEKWVKQHPNWLKADASP